MEGSILLKNRGFAGPFEVIGRTEPTKVSLGLVTYNSLRVLPTLVESLRKCRQKGLLMDVFVVDHESHDGTLEYLRQNLPWAVIESHPNRGFGAGHNLILRRISHEGGVHFIANPDTQFSPETLRKMIFHLNRNPEIGLVGPRFQFPDGRHQELLRPLPSLSQMTLRALHKLSRMTKMVFFTKILDRHIVRKVGEPRCLSGAFLCLRRDILPQVGFFDEGYFLYLEDVDFTRRVAERTGIAVVDQAVVTHALGAMSDRRFIYFLRHLKSAIRYFNKWGWFSNGENSRARPAIP